MASPELTGVFFINQLFCSEPLHSRAQPAHLVKKTRMHLGGQQCSKPAVQGYLDGALPIRLGGGLL